MNFIITQLKNITLPITKYKEIKIINIIDLIALIYEKHKLKWCILFEITYILVHLIVVGKLVCKKKEQRWLKSFFL